MCPEHENMSVGSNSWESGSSVRQTTQIINWISTLLIKTLSLMKPFCDWAHHVRHLWLFSFDWWFTVGMTGQADFYKSNSDTSNIHIKYCRIGGLTTCWVCSCQTKKSLLDHFANASITFTDSFCKDYQPFWAVMWRMLNVCQTFCLSSWENLQFWLKRVPGCFIATDIPGPERLLAGGSTVVEVVKSPEAYCNWLPLDCPVRPSMNGCRISWDEMKKQQCHWFITRGILTFQWQCLLFLIWDILNVFISTITTWFWKGYCYRK